MTSRHCGLPAHVGTNLLGVIYCGLVWPLIECGLTLGQAKGARALGGSPYESLAREKRPSLFCLFTSEKEKDIFLLTPGSVKGG
jgi:hypothetical protein